MAPRPKALAAGKAKAKAVTPTLSPADRNKNKERQDAKNAWNRFNRSLACLEQESEAVKLYQSIGRSQKKEFYNAWQNDPTWEFVKVFKRRVVSNTTTSQTQKTWKSMKFLIKEYGLQGAKRHAEAMKALGSVRKHKTSGILLYPYSEDMEIDMHCDKREVESAAQGTAGALADGGGQQQLLALEDGEGDSEREEVPPEGEGEHHEGEDAEEEDMEVDDEVEESDVPLAPQADMPPVRVEADMATPEEMHQAKP